MGSSENQEWIASNLQIGLYAASSTEIKEGLSGSSQSADISGYFCTRVMMLLHRLGNHLVR